MVKRCSFYIVHLILVEISDKKKNNVGCCALLQHKEINEKGVVILVVSAVNQPGIEMNYFCFIPYNMYKRFGPYSLFGNWIYIL